MSGRCWPGRPGDEGGGRRKRKAGMMRAPKPVRLGASRDGPSGRSGILGIRLVFVKCSHRLLSAHDFSRSRWFGMIGKPVPGRWYNAAPSGQGSCLGTLTTSPLGPRPAPRGGVLRPELPRRISGPTGRVICPLLSLITARSRAPRGFHGDGSMVSWRPWWLQPHVVPCTGESRWC